jgi:hypothetical protein
MMNGARSSSSLIGWMTHTHTRKTNLKFACRGGVPKVHIEILRGVLKKSSIFKVVGVYSEGVQLYAKIKCMSTNCSK